MAAIARELKLSTVPDITGGWLSGKVVGRNNAHWSPKYQGDVRMPDVTGLNLRDALFILKQGFKVTFKGRGKVTSQDYRENGTQKKSC